MVLSPHAGRSCRLHARSRRGSRLGRKRQGFDVYLATGLSEGVPDREVTEQDMVHRAFTDAEIDAMLRSGAIVDAPSLAALTLYRLATGE
jgi:hypothetical protein